MCTADSGRTSATPPVVLEMARCLERCGAGCIHCKKQDYCPAARDVLAAGDVQE